MHGSAGPPDTTQRAATTTLGELDAQRAELADRFPRRPRWYYPAMGLLLGAGIAVGVLDNPVISVIAVPFTLYAFVSLAGVGEWQRAGISPRRPRGPQVVGFFVYVLLILPVVWGSAVLLDRTGHSWALIAAGVAVPVLVAAGRVWLTRQQRHRLLHR